MSSVPIALEVGARRTFAIALDWPGWSRAGIDPDVAIDALIRAAPRYADVLRKARIRGFPRSVTSCEVVERLDGDASTDFGAPGATPSIDRAPTSSSDIERLSAIVSASWAAFDASAEAAEGAELATGPRGGGRTLEEIRNHVAESDVAYVKQLGGTTPKGADAAAVRDAFLVALAARARGELPDVGPRGGRRWTARFAARRASWHALDHAWEIEDRVVPEPG